jgi:hypothetical protein
MGARRKVALQENAKTTIRFSDRESAAAVRGNAANLLRRIEEKIISDGIDVGNLSARGRSELLMRGLSASSLATIALYELADKLGVE